MLRLLKRFGRYKRDQPRDFSVGTGVCGGVCDRFSAGMKDSAPEAAGKGCIARRAIGSGGGCPAGRSDICFCNQDYEQPALLMTSCGPSAGPRRMTGCFGGPGPREFGWAIASQTSSRRHH